MFKSDPENPVRAVQREHAARRPERRLETSAVHHAAANGMVGSAVQRVIGLTRVPKGAPEANTQQAMAEHIGDDVHGEEGGNQRQQILCGA